MLRIYNRRILNGRIAILCARAYSDSERHCKDSSDNTSLDHFSPSAANDA
jgi:hypothetical protein